MTSSSILLDVLILLATATVLGAICERLRQSALVGYLIAGMLLGPNALHWVASMEEVEVLAELGVALLLFTIGLEFSWRQLRQFGASMLLGGVLQVVLTMSAAAGAAAIFGAGGKAAVAIGAVAALSSTACVLRVLHQRAELDSRHGRSAVGILLVQDLALIPLVLLLEVLGGTGSLSAAAWAVAKTVAAAIVLVTAFWVVFDLLIPRLLGAQFVARNRELPILLAVVTALGAAWAAQFAGLSPAIGAFVAGMLLGGSLFATQVRTDVGSLRTLLVTLFFSSVGMFAAPGWMLDHWLELLGLVAAIILGKSVLIWFLMRRLGRTHANAMATGICLGQVGEFSFVLAGIASKPEAGVFGDDLFQLVISATIVTLVLTPFLVAAAPWTGRRFEALLRRRPIDGTGEDDGEREGRPGAPKVLIIGLGPAGQKVAETLMHHGVRASVIDLNPQVAAKTAPYGFTAHVGEASQPGVLRRAGLDVVEMVAVTLPDPATAVRAIQQVRLVAPDVRIVARARYNRYSTALRQAGADVVVDEEEEIGERLAAVVREQVRPSADSADAAKP